MGIVGRRAVQREACPRAFQLPRLATPGVGAAPDRVRARRGRRGEPRSRTDLDLAGGRHHRVDHAGARGVARGAHDPRALVRQPSNPRCPADAVAVPAAGALALAPVDVAGLPLLHAAVPALQPRPASVLPGDHGGQPRARGRRHGVHGARLLHLADRTDDRCGVRGRYRHELAAPPAYGHAPRVLGHGHRSNRHLRGRSPAHVWRRARGICFAHPKVRSSSRGRHNRLR